MAGQGESQERARGQLARLVANFQEEVGQEPDESSQSLLNAIQFLVDLTIGADVLQDDQLNSSCITTIACLLVAGYNYNALRRNYREVANFSKKKEEYGLLISQLERVIREVKDRNETIAAHATTICDVSRDLVEWHHKPLSDERDQTLPKLISQLADVVGDFNAEVGISQFMLEKAQRHISDFLKDLKEAEERNNVQAVINGALPQVAPLASLARTNSIAFAIAAVGSLGTLFYNLIRQKTKAEEIQEMTNKLQVIKTEIEELLVKLEKNQLRAKIKIELLRQSEIISDTFPGILDK